MKSIHKKWALFKKIRVVFIFGLMTLINQHCKEVYIMNELNKDQIIPVFNALLTNIPQVCSLQLKYASPIQITTNNPIKNATITIFEYDIPVFNLIEEQNRIYKTPEDAPNLKFKHQYTIEIIMPNGEILKS